MKFNSTCELLIYLGKENLLTTFVYEEYHKSTQLTLFDGDNNEAGILLTPEIDSQLLDLLRNYCSRNTDGEFNFYGYDLLIDEENKLQFKVEKHVNAYFSQSFRLDEFVSVKEICDIFSNYQGHSISVEEFEQDYYLRVDDLDLEGDPDDEIDNIYISVPDDGESDDAESIEDNAELKKDLFFYFKVCFTSGNKNTITIEDGGLKYWYSQFEIIDADYFDDEEEYEVPDTETLA